jgi:chromosome segregation ATPase
MEEYERVSVELTKLHEQRVDLLKNAKLPKSEIKKIESTIVDGMGETLPF